MKICFMGEGTSLHLHRWVNYFSEKGHEVHVIASRFPADSQGYNGRTRLHRINRFAPRIWAVSRYVSGATWPFQVRGLLNRIKPDVLDAHFITLHGYLGIFSGFHPIVLTAWGSDVLITPRKSLLHRRLTKYSLKRADAVVCDSETVKAALLELGTEPGKIEIIYNGVDTQQFNPAKRSQALRTELGAGSGPIVICIRHLAPAYNVEMLVRAIPAVVEAVPETRFVIGGEGAQRGYLENLVSTSGVSEKVRFTGSLPHEQIMRHLASSDVYVSTSLADSTSLSLQEGMASGLAPVVTDLPANREWITDGENGFIVEPGDVAALAEKIIYLLRNEAVRTSFGTRCREIVRERAEYRDQMGRAEQIYQRLAGKS